MNRQSAHRLRHLGILSFALIIALSSTLTLSGLSTAQAAPNSPLSTTITVNSLSDNTTTCAIQTTMCLRRALTLAQANASATTVNFDTTLSGTLTLTSTLTINNTATNPITINGHPMIIVLDGGSTSASTGVRIFCILPGSVLTINNMSEQNGNANGQACGADSFPNGGAIRNYGTLIMTDSNFSSNMTGGFGSGGGIFNTGTLNISLTGFSQDFASGSGSGGAIANSVGITTLDSVDLDSNGASSGGGLASFGGAVMMTNTWISQNSAKVSGGGISVFGGTLTMRNSLVEHNSIPTDPGHSDELGGGLYNTAATTISNSTFDENTGALGGGIGNVGTLFVGNSTFANNTALLGGGIYSTDTVDMLSTLLSGNLSFGAGPNYNGSVSSFGYNLIKNATGASGFSAIGDQVGVDPNIGALSSNGGPLETIALNPGSPALVSGNCAGGASGQIPVVAVDQRGISRKNPNGSFLGCDIGAFELPNLDSIGIYRNGVFLPAPAQLVWDRRYNRPVYCWNVTLPDCRRLDWFGF